MDALTAAHRAAQLRLRAATVREMLALWPALDPERLDETTLAWARAAEQVIRQQHTASARLSAAYLGAFRTSKLGRAGQVLLAAPLPAEQLTTSLRVTGPVAIMRLVSSGKTFSVADSIAFVLHSGAASRLALDGGRQTIATTLASDQRAVGFQRITSGNACKFCEVLAGRGAVYLSATTAGEDEPYHDHCACTVEPLYD